MPAIPPIAESSTSDIESAPLPQSIGIPPPIVEPTVIPNKIRVF